MERTLSVYGYESILKMCRNHELCTYCAFYGEGGCEIEFEDGSNPGIRTEYEELDND